MSGHKSWTFHLYGGACLLLARFSRWEEGRREKRRQPSLHCARPTRGVRDRALREHRRSSGSIPLSVPGAQDQRGCPSIPLVLFCTRCVYYTVPMPLRSELSFTDSLTSEQRQIFYARHRFLAILMILIVLLFPFAGLYVIGLFGAVLGVLLSVAGYYLTPYVWLTVGR